MERFGTRFLTILFVLCMVVSLFPISAFAKGIEDDTTIENAKVSIWGVDSPYDFSFDFQSLTEGDNTCYSQPISIFASLMAEDVSIQKGRQIIVDNRSGYFMEQMGFKDIERIVLNSDDYTPYDYNDVSVVYIGRRPMTVNDREYVVYGVGIVDSFNNSEFWKSNMDIGASGEEYRDVTGEHDPSWNTDHTKGFDVTANRVHDEVEDYLIRHTAEDVRKTKSMLITGHSRGAAIANLVGKRYEDKQDGAVKPYTYTYAAPYTTTVDENEAQSYETIFNIINANDLVANIPPTDVAAWNFRRYGTDKIVNIDEDEALEDEWNKTIALMIESELETLSSKGGSSEKKPIQLTYNITSENALRLLEILNRIFELREKKPVQYDALIDELEEQDIRFSRKIDKNEYVSADGADIPKILGELFLSRQGFYTKNVETTLSFCNILTLDAFIQKMEELKLSTYYDITGEMDPAHNVPVNVCPAIFVESAFSAMGQQGLNMDYVNILVQGFLNEKSGGYPLAIIQAILHAPQLINGVRLCHSAQTYYFLANKIASDPNERQQEDLGRQEKETKGNKQQEGLNEKEETVMVTAQNAKIIYTGITHDGTNVWIIIVALVGLVIVMMGLILYRNRKRD